jgi:hypothetical protein
MKRLFAITLSLAVLAATGVTAVAQDAAPDEALIKERQAQVADKLARIPNRLSEFDYVEFGISGPVVNLRGFSIQPSVKKEAESQVRQLDWVTHVVNEIDFIPNEPNVSDLRQETLSILRTAAPQAFPGDFAHLRIKIDQALNVTLVGKVFPGDQKRIEAAVVQINQLPLVKGVDNQISYDRVAAKRK